MLCLDGKSENAVFYLNGVDYYYILNGQGDVVSLIDKDNNRMVEYQYDSWGKPTLINDTSTDGAGMKNPFRYRGYVWDAETELYYLGSRYYDAEVGRFVNADDTVIIDVQDDLYDKNLYAYCDNNLINRIDEVGNIWEFAFAGMGAMSIGSGLSISSVGTSMLTVLGVAAPVTLAIIGTVAVISAVSLGVKYAKAKEKTKGQEKAKGKEKTKSKEKERVTSELYH